MAASQNVAVVCLLKLFSDNDEHDSGNLYRMHSDGMEADEEVLITAASAAAVMPSSDERIQGCVPNFFEEVVPSYSISTFRSHFRTSPSTLEVNTMKRIYYTIPFAILQPSTPSAADAYYVCKISQYLNAHFYNGV